MMSRGRPCPARSESSMSRPRYAASFFTPSRSHIVHHSPFQARPETTHDSGHYCERNMRQATSIISHPGVLYIGKEMAIIHNGEAKLSRVERQVSLAFLREARGHVRLHVAFARVNGHIPQVYRHSLEAIIPIVIGGRRGSHGIYGVVRPVV